MTSMTIKELATVLNVKVENCIKAAKTKQKTYSVDLRVGFAATVPCKKQLHDI